MASFWKAFKLCSFASTSSASFSSVCGLFCGFNLTKFAAVLTNPRTPPASRRDFSVFPLPFLQARLHTEMPQHQDCLRGVSAAPNPVHMTILHSCQNLASWFNHPSLCPQLSPRPLGLTTRCLPRAVALLGAGRPVGTHPPPPLRAVPTPSTNAMSTCCTWGPP